MQRNMLLAGLATAAALTMAVPASAGTKYYFECGGPQPITKVQNLQARGWTTTAPAASFTTGAGCGSLDPGLLSTSQSGFEFDFYGGGTHTGPIQALNVELHSLLLSQARIRQDMGVELDLVVDGESVLGELTGLRNTPEVSSTGATEKFVFSISRVKPAGSTTTPPLVAEDGPHTVQLRFSSQYLDYQNAWVWGTSEVPAHVEVDPDRLAYPKYTG